MEDFLKDTKDDFKKANAEAAAIKARSEAKDATELVQDADNRAPAAQETVAEASSAPKASATPAEAAPSSKKKKSSKPQKLVYTDDSESPEEKLAKRASYAFKRDDAS